MPTHLSILVSGASPLDYARYRHASLYFEFENEESLKSALMEVVGSPGFLSFSERVNIELPVSSTVRGALCEMLEKQLMDFGDIARVVRVCSLSDTVAVSSIRRTVAETPIMNDADWNSQNWVGDALARLVEAGYLDEEAERKGLDEMVDAVMEASDEKC
ncbi:uncharacterized protein N7477_006812 [Penicillium maclennaniae]|uniref:uncharacterized protein n=1 Tax=Penicillium maclennaniae TaxID=1343394 RepID=UPI00253F6585|nr:uncharacterized protein N7477_006812 [Penicillium maclennaniae]KAJ5668242.1 hypothetical protein N7477_006812 [Penicillium maclennaniae]